MQTAFQTILNLSTIWLIGVCLSIPFIFIAEYFEDRSFHACGRRIEYNDVLTGIFILFLICLVYYISTLKQVWWFINYLSLGFIFYFIWFAILERIIPDEKCLKYERQLMVLNIFMMACFVCLSFYIGIK